MAYPFNAAGPRLGAILGKMAWLTTIVTNLTATAGGTFQDPLVVPAHCRQFLSCPIGLWKVQWVWEHPQQSFEVVWIWELYRVKVVVGQRVAPRIGGTLPS